MRVDVCCATAIIMGCHAYANYTGTVGSPFNMVFDFEQMHVDVCCAPAIMQIIL